MSSTGRERRTPGAVRGGRTTRETPACKLPRIAQISHGLARRNGGQWPCSRPARRIKGSFSKEFYDEEISKH
ncbi:MAG: hypothetical protein KGR98_15615, partial [Verrucomicrobia bacterium]|nr:hypothetical protein [Verrucomicrobiota bacterium]